MAVTILPIRAALSICLLVLSAGAAAALEMKSASYTSLGGNTNGGGSVDLTSTASSPAFSEGAGSVGQSEAVGLSGSPSDLTTGRPGFWAIAEAGLPSLDADSDGIQSFLDDDDDNDGLTDDVETRTGTFASPSDTGTDPNNPDSDGDGLSDGVETDTEIFVSPSDTGTDPNNPDSDGDGVLDGPEVLAGTDPNVFDPPGVPALSTLGRGIAVAWLAISSARRLRRNQSRKRSSKSM
jgi:hypothetical protein